MAFWDVAERIVNSVSNPCRSELQATLERPASHHLTPACKAEVGVMLERQSRGEDVPRRGKEDGLHAKTISPDGERMQPEAAPAGANPATIVLSFVGCALVAFAAIGFYVSGAGKSGRQPTRYDKKQHRKKHDRLRERGKRRR